MARFISFHRSRIHQTRFDSAGGEDSRLILRLRSGDEAALIDVMDRYWSILLGFAIRLVGDKYTAEEICQDTMVKVWQQARLFRVDGDLRAWLFRVVRNAAIDHKRKRQPPAEELATSLPAITQCPTNMAEQSWLNGQLEAALRELPLVYREAIELRFFHHLGYQEVADVLGIPVGTVKSRISYALTRLTNLLQARGLSSELAQA